MAESGIPYELITPSSTVVFNDWTQDVTFKLDRVTGLRPKVRKSYTPRPHRDGARVGRGMKDAMFPLLEGTFVHNGPAAGETMRRQLESAAYSILDEPGILRWRPSDSPGEWRSVNVELYETPDDDGDLFKKFQIPLIAGFPFIYGETQHISPSTYVNPSGGGGLTFPFTFPLDFADPGSTGTGTFTNAGDNDTWPVFKINGPISDPTLLSNTMGMSIKLTSNGGLDLLAGQYCLIDTWEQTVTDQSGNSMSKYVNWATSLFFPFKPGPNTVTLNGSGANPVLTNFDASWYDSYA